MCLNAGPQCVSSLVRMYVLLVSEMRTRVGDLKRLMAHLG